jgi:allantoinase
MTLLIKNGSVVRPDGVFPLDVLCEGEHIAQLLERGASVRSADEEIDATGLLVFPGFIDPHVHSRDPGNTEKEDFEHSTRAAAAGGATTILEMPNAVPPVIDLATMESRVAQHARNAFVDFGIWGMSIGMANLDEMKPMLDAGAVGIKLFWGFSLDRRSMRLIYNPKSGSGDDVIPPPSLSEVRQLMTEIAQHGGLLAAHCEEPSLIEHELRNLGHPMRSYDDMLTVHSELAEAASIALGCELARVTGCRFHVLHMSTGRGAELVRRGQLDGINVTAETCPHYLALTADDYARIGPIMKVYPPIRGRVDRDLLREAVRAGYVTSVGSDHAPHTLQEKEAGLAEAPAGGVGVETLGSVMVNEMVEGRLPASRLAWVLSEGNARLYGLYPQKGAILVGSEADFTLVDPNRDHVVEKSRLHTKQQQSPWAGQTLKGTVTHAILRGQTIMKDGEPVGSPSGRFIRAGRGDSGGNR